jgi:hypothetical protein
MPYSQPLIAIPIYFSLGEVTLAITLAVIVVTTLAFAVALVDFVYHIALFVTV